MKRMVFRLALVAPSAVFLLGLAGTALAHPGFGHGWAHGWDWDHHHWGSAPEIDPSLMSSGLALLAGSVMLVVERYRRHRR